MKPRLKLTNDGHLIVLASGLNPWGESSARKYIQEHYGSLNGFAQRFHFSYNAVCKALRPIYRPEKMAGQVAVIRMALGLKSQPTLHAIRVAASQEHRP